MGKMESAMREEFLKLARREVKAAVDPVMRQVRELRRELVALRRIVGVQARALKPPDLPDVPDPADQAVEQSRFSPGLVKKLRKKLGVNQAQLARLAGVSPHTVSKWESGKSRPRGKIRATLVALRQLGKRQARQLLEEQKAAAQGKA